jgi:phage FluMu protein Com
MTMMMAPVELEDWRCHGRAKDGRECRRILLEVDLSAPTVLRKKCDACGTLNTLHIVKIQMGEEPT